MDFVARLAALAWPAASKAEGQPHPLPWRPGTCAARPNHRWRGLVTPARRGKGVKSNSNTEVHTPAERHAAMTWAQRLKRVFNIDIEACSFCGGSVRVIACIEDQDVIDRILDHLRQKERETPTRPLLLPRAWCHRPERHLERCHFSLGRARGSRFQTNSNPLARKPGKPHGTSGCARSFRIDQIGMACPTPRTGFSGQ